MTDEEIKLKRLSQAIEEDMTENELFEIARERRYRINDLQKENARLSQMLDVSFMSFLPRSLEMVACSQCEYDDFGYCRIDKRDNVDYKYCKKCYREALLKRAELEKRVENEK